MRQRGGKEDSIKNKRERERCRVKGREGGRKKGSKGVREEKKEREGICT